MGFLLSESFNYKGVMIDQGYVNIRVRDFKPKWRLNFVAQFYINQATADDNDLENLLYYKTYHLGYNNPLFDQYFSMDIISQAGNDLIKQCYEYLKFSDTIFSNAQSL